MWPFRTKSRRTLPALPAWTYRAVADDIDCSLALAAGRWKATDGALPREAVSLGALTAPDARLRTRSGSEGLELVTLDYVADPPPDLSTTEIVVDSGVIVLLCADRFDPAGVTTPDGSLALRRALDAAGPGALALVSEESGRCVGIAVWPPFGDGAYRLRFAREAGRTVLQMDVGESV